MARHDLVLVGLRTSFPEPANIVKVPAMIEQINQNYVTDLTPDLIASLVCMLSEVPTDLIEFMEITRE